VVTTEQGRIDPAFLDLVREGHYQARFPAYHQHSHPSPPAEERAELTVDQPIRRTGKAYGHISCGWIFHHDRIFQEGTFRFLNSIGPAIRVKGVFRTDQGWALLNRIDKVEDTSDVFRSVWPNLIAFLDHLLAATHQRNVARIFGSSLAGASFFYRQFQAASITKKQITFFHVTAISHWETSIGCYSGRLTTRQSASIIFRYFSHFYQVSSIRISIKSLQNF
jgi:hypothetical protein